MNKILVLILGGSLGTLCRAWLAEWGNRQWGTVFPYGTLAVNLVGCLIIGLLLGFFEARYGNLAASPYLWRMLLVTGFLGALTTFSSYELEAFLFLRHGQWERALIYLGVSILLGLGLIWLGAHGGRFLAGGIKPA